MYNKTAFSKSVGFNKGVSGIPSLEEVQEKIDAAKSGDTQAAQMIFRWYRFCPSGTNPNEVKVINTIYDAFVELFK